MTSDSHSPTPPAQAPDNPPVVSVSSSYVLILGGLLILILASLAFLWMRERGRRIDAENFARQCQERSEAMQANLGKMLMLSGLEKAGGKEPSGRESSGAAIAPFQRQDHVPVTVTLDGAQRQAYRLPTRGAERFGFREGDVILVVGGAASQPEATP